MALAASSEWTTYDDTLNTNLDISDVLSAILLVDDNFLAKVNSGKRSLDTVHYWVEDSLVSNKVTQLSTESALDASGTSLVLAADQGLRVRIGALLRDEAAGKSEILQVTAISTDTLTVVRGYGTSTGETHAVAATFRVIGMPKQEGADTQNSLNVAKTRQSNATQIFERGIYLTGSFVQRPQVAIQDHVKWEVHKKVLELRREMSSALIDSVIAATAAGNDTTYRSMSGLREFISQATDPNTDSTSQAMSVSTLEDLLLKCWDKGGAPNTVVGNIRQIKKIADLYKENVRYAPSDRVRGTLVQKFLSSQGFELDLAPNHWVNQDEVMVLDMSKAFLVPYRDMLVEPIAPTGDAKKWQVIGEYTLELRNRAEAHGLKTNLTV